MDFVSLLSRGPRPASGKGQVLAMVAVSMVVLLGSAAFALDIGYLHVTRNQLQNVADGSALAGARMLGNIYQGIPHEEQPGYVCNAGCASAIQGVALDVATSNWAGGEAMTLRVEDVAIGQWDGDTFTETMVLPDAVQAIARRDDLANGPIASFFAWALGIRGSPVNTHAIAALSGQGTAGEGELELPIGISRWFFDNQPDGAFCNEDVQFYPTNDPASCAGWTSWEYGSNDVTLRNILDENPDYPGPGTIAGETIFNFTGGTLSEPTFDALLSLFQRKGYDVDEDWNYLLDEYGDRITQATADQGAVPLMELDNDGIWVQSTYPDGTPRNKHKWETTLPVYARDDCSNPNQEILIVGFAEIELRDVLNAPDKLVRGTVKCNLVDNFPTRGGGGEYGVKGSIPGLVR